MRYKVEWHIDFDETDCSNVLDAARQARRIMMEPNTIAIVYKVVDKITNETYLVDLLDNSVMKV